MTFAVCKASARMRRITSPSLLTTYDAKVPSGIPSSHAVEMVPVLAMATRVLAHSAEVGRSESMSAVSPAAVAGADVAVSVATARGATRACDARRDAGLATAARRLLVPAPLRERVTVGAVTRAAETAVQVAAIVRRAIERSEWGAPLLGARARRERGVVCELGPGPSSRDKIASVGGTVSRPITARQKEIR